MLPTVLITNDVPDDHLAPLAGVADVIKGSNGFSPMPREEIIKLAPSLSGIINQAELRVDEELLDAGSKLSIIANMAIGADNLDTTLMAERGVWATNVPDAFTESTADHTFGLLLAVARRLVPADNYVRSGQWIHDGFQPGKWDGMELCGKTIGIVGFGKIGRAVARRAEAFGMKVIMNSPSQTDQPTYRELHVLLAEADVVSLHVPLLPQTRRLINSNRLRQMRPGSILINMARGPVVDEAALIDVLASGHLAGAGLDVFEQEPRVGEALFGMQHVVMSPHVGGGTRESRRSGRLLCTENIALVLQGKPPRTPLNQPVGALSVSLLPNAE